MRTVAYGCVRLRAGTLGGRASKKPTAFYFYADKTERSAALHSDLKPWAFGAKALSSWNESRQTQLSELKPSGLRFRNSSHSKLKPWAFGAKALSFQNESDQISASGTKARSKCKHKLATAPEMRQGCIGISFQQSENMIPGILTCQPANLPTRKTPKAYPHIY